MIDKIASIFKKKTTAAEEPEKVFSTDFDYPKTQEESQYRLENALAKSFQREVEIMKPIDRNAPSGTAMDSALKPSMYNLNAFGSCQSIISEAQLAWYASQGFISFQACAIIAQHWLVDKACTIPAEDAIRNGYDITVNDGQEVDEEVINEIRKQNKKFKLDQNMLQYVRFGRIFGIRVAIFKIESSDPMYYEKPFNLDGITPGSYKGIAQVDPYWMAPELDEKSVTDPSSIDFYEPTYWNINGIRYHKSHLVIMKNSEVADILKSTYFYGGVSVPQKIYERVYAAERSANEAPQLLLTKRSVIYKTDMAKAVSKQAQFENKVAFSTQFMNNYGVRAIDNLDEVVHIDTALGDIDNLIMTQYQLVAAIAGIPADKLIETAPKGFNATGEYQQKNYHESLESIQTHYLDPLAERHIQILIRSVICPQFNIPPFDFDVTWSALNSVDAKEQAEINKMKAETSAVLITAGAIDGEDVRKTIINDPDSGFNGLDIDDMPDPIDDEPTDDREFEDVEEPYRSAERL